MLIRIDRNGRTFPNKVQEIDPLFSIPTTIPYSWYKYFLITYSVNYSECTFCASIFNFLSRQKLFC